MKLEHHLATGGFDSRRFRRALDCSTEAIVLVEPREDRIVDANSTACSMFGYTRGELLQMRVSQMHPNDMALLIGFSESVSRFGHGWTQDLSCLTKSGELVPAEVSACAVEGSDHDRMVVIIRGRRDRSSGGQFAWNSSTDFDRGISAHSSAHENMASAARVHARILDTIDHGVILIGPGTRIAVVNAAAARILGRKQDALVGQDLWRVLEIRESRHSLAHAREAVAAALAEGRALPLGVVNLSSVDGLQVPVQIACLPLQDGDCMVRSVMTLRTVESSQDVITPRRLSPLPSDLATRNSELAAFTPEGIVGRTAQMRGILERIALVAPTQATVLITGESGTGKELAARAIHRLSRRSDKPFIKVNCSTVPRELFESEFFGHVKGAYTGAISERRGRFELADGGTLFLDEIGELPIEMQSKLLGVLQEGRFERVGDARSREVDVRIVAATNRDLEAEIGAGRFRLDLYYRLSVFPVHVPPLRARRDDIPLLVEHMLAAALRRAGRGEQVLSDDQMSLLTAYDWPGNVRELQNIIECAVISAREGEPLRFDLRASTQVQDVAPSFGPKEGSRVLNETQRKEIERNNIVSALKRTGGRVGGPGGAAELLGVKPTTLRSRMKAFGIETATVVSAQGGERHAELGASNIESRAARVSSTPGAFECDKTVSLARTTGRGPVYCAEALPATSLRRGPISLVK